MMSDLGLSQVQLGWVLAAFAWGYAIFQWPGGLLGDWLGGRKALTLIAVLFFIKFAAFAMYLTPFWDIPDESGHYSYVEDLSHGRLPVLGEARMSRDIADSWIGPGARQARAAG